MLGLLQVLLCHLITFLEKTGLHARFSYSLCNLAGQLDSDTNCFFKCTLYGQTYVDT